MSSPITSGGVWRGSGSSTSDKACMAASLPSEWGMLVYKDDTSIDASRHSSGGLKPSIRFLNSVVSLMNEGSFSSVVVAKCLDIVICFL